MPRKRDQLPQLGDRQRDLLRAVIREYIATAQPVASAALVRKYRLDLSSATVRNELATLEEFGLLTHPHTSAGRVPTDLGYRYFIESLMPRPSLQPEEQVTVSHQFQQALSNTSEWLRLAASTLARLTTEAAIVTPPGRTTYTPTGSRTSSRSRSSRPAAGCGTCCGSWKTARAWSSCCHRRSATMRSTSRSAASTGWSRSAAAVSCSAATAPAPSTSVTSGSSARRAWTTRARSAPCGTSVRS